MGKLLSKLSNKNNGAKSPAGNNKAASAAEEKKSAAAAADAPAESKEQTISEKADTMQEVLDNIFMGSYAAAKDKSFLLDQKITHILAIGWDLKAHFPDDFKYLILSQVEDNPSYTILKHFEEAFQFMDTCLRPESNQNQNQNSSNPNSNNNNNNNSSSSSSSNSNNNSNEQQQGRLLVHCHKGLSRSASIIMGYEMSRRGISFKQVLDKIREKRSFIMPNIGFQAQLQVFEEKDCSLDMSLYKDMDVMARISAMIPGMFDKIRGYYDMFEAGKEEDIDQQELFGLTMYFHQLFMLRKERGQLPPKDDEYLNNAIQTLHDIQTKFIQIESSIVRFEKLFKLGKYAKQDKARKKKKKKGAQGDMSPMEQNKDSKDSNGANDENVENKENAAENEENAGQNAVKKEHKEFEPEPEKLPELQKRSSQKIAMETAYLAAEASDREDDDDVADELDQDEETIKNTKENTGDPEVAAKVVQAAVDDAAGSGADGDEAEKGAETAAAETFLKDENELADLANEKVDAEQEAEPTEETGLVNNNNNSNDNDAEKAEDQYHD